MAPYASPGVYVNFLGDDGEGDILGVLGAGDQGRPLGEAPVGEGANGLKWGFAWGEQLAAKPAPQRRNRYGVETYLADDGLSCHGAISFTT